MRFTTTASYPNAERLPLPHLQPDGADAGFLCPYRSCNVSDTCNVRGHEAGRFQTNMAVAEKRDEAVRDLCF